MKDYDMILTQVKVWRRENTYNDFYEIIEILQIPYFMSNLLL